MSFACILLFLQKTENCPITAANGSRLYFVYNKCLTLTTIAPLYRGDTMSLCHECLFIYANCKIKHYVTPINAHESKLGGKIRELRKSDDTFSFSLDWKPNQLRPVTYTFVFSSVCDANDRQGVINFCRRCRIIYVSPLSTGERKPPRPARFVTSAFAHFYNE